MGKYAIIEIGSNNTKTHVYDNNALIYHKTTTIEFKKNYQERGLYKNNNIYVTLTNE